MENFELESFTCENLHVRKGEMRWTGIAMKHKWQDRRWQIIMERLRLEE